MYVKEDTAARQSNLYLDKETEVSYLKINTQYRK